MLGFRTHRPVAEHEASGEIERVFHEIKQTLRVTGINLNFRTWAGHREFLPAAWDAVRPNVETAAFEHAAESLRQYASCAADELGPLNASGQAQLGESQAFHVRNALELYNEVNPKLLVLTSAVCLALAGQAVGGEPVPAVERLPKGPPPKMAAMEMEAESPSDERIKRLFEDIKSTLSLPAINSDYRTLALWPDYLDAAWCGLKPIVQSERWNTLAQELRGRARELARKLPHRMELSREALEKAGIDVEEVLMLSNSIEQILPGLIVNVALLVGDWKSPLQSAAVPGGLNCRRKFDGGRWTWRDYQRVQRVVELGENFVSYLDEGEGPPLVLIHGIPTWGYLWRQQIPKLSQSFRVLAPDLLGFGFSDRRDCFDRSIARQAEMIERWMEKLGVERAAVAAHDIGGGVALRLATLFPHRVERLCLMNSVCYDSWPIELMLQAGHPGTNKKLSAATAVKLLRQAIKQGFAHSPDGDLLDALLAPYRTEVGKLSLIRNASALNTNLTTEITRRLPEISLPVLILWGEDDKFQRVKYGERLAWDIPNAKLVRIPDARHFVMFDQPEQVCEHVRSFAAATPVNR